MRVCLSLIITPVGPPGSPSPSLFFCYWLTSFRYISQLRLFMVIFQLLSLLFTSLTPCTHAHRANTFKTKTWHYAEHANCLPRWNGREGRWGGKRWAFSGCGPCRLLGASPLITEPLAAPSSEGWFIVLISQEATGRILTRERENTGSSRTNEMQRPLTIIAWKAAAVAVEPLNVLDCDFYEVNDISRLLDDISILLAD